MRADRQQPLASPAPAVNRGGAFVSPVGSRRVEVSLAVAMSIFGVLFTFQSVPALLAQWPSMNSPIGLAVVVLVFGTIAVAGLAAVLRQWTRPIFLTAGVAYLIGLGLWPAALVAPLTHGEIPWILQLATVPAGFVIVGRRDWVIPALYVIVVALDTGLLRASPAGGQVDFGREVLDAVYSLALSAGLLILTAAVRLAANSVDIAQNNALQRYAAAKIDEAMEAERVATDALVHDSVLTTFLSASTARTPEAKALAARMARMAMGHLTRATVAAETGPRVALAELIPRIRREGEMVADRFSFTAEGVSGHEIPASVADAMVLAVVQAMVNSVKHAGGDEVARAVSVRGAADGSMQVVVADRGCGFEPVLIADERLGVRVSILERIRLAGGEAELQTAPGAGTRVVLSWPSVAAGSVVQDEDEEALALE
jgi:signal transduction histidine kinase